jgi:pyruvate dehydrogenase E1 component beta subunit
VELIDLRTIYPYDCETVLSSVRKTGRVVVVHEGPRSFGVAAELIALVTEELFMYLDAPPRRVTGSDAVIPLPAAEHFYFVTAEHIVDAVQETAEF